MTAAIDMTDHPNMAEAAVACARLIPVFPVWPVLPFQNGGFICGCGRLNCENQGKHPIGRLAPHGVNDAAVDEARVRHWWAARPDANIGAATGHIIGVDVDPRHGGDTALGKLEGKHGSLPRTWRVITGGGGEHVYFRAPATPQIRNSAGKLGHGIDIRGHGGNVVLPPSLHISGRRYAWRPGHGPDETPLAPLPGWILTTIEQEKKAASKTAWRELAGNDIAEGARNDSLARFAGYLLRRFVEPHVVLELLLAWNTTHCKPPLSCDEVAGTVNSIAGKEFRRRSKQ
jgi:hypothetical protein